MAILRVSATPDFERPDIGHFSAMKSDFALLKSGLSATLVAATRQIIAALPQASTGSLRAQHLGIYLAIIALSEAGEDATTRHISSLLGHQRSHVNRIASNLVEAKVVGRDRVLAAHGRGHQYVYFPVADFDAIRAMQNLPSTK